MSFKKTASQMLRAIMTLDDPFSPVEDTQGAQSSNDDLLHGNGHMISVATPLGDEAVDPYWCEEPTRIMKLSELQTVWTHSEKERQQEREQIMNLISALDFHTRPTLQSMTAVRTPTSGEYPRKRTSGVLQLVLDEPPPGDSQETVEQRKEG